MNVFRQNTLTVRGHYNRWRRSRDKGVPLFEVDEMKLLHYKGIDDLDRNIFGQFLAVKLPYIFEWGKDLPSPLYNDVLEWIRLSMAGRGHFYYNPMIAHGYLYLENPNDAFAFRMRFSPEVQMVDRDPETVAIGEEAVRKYGLANL